MLTWGIDWAAEAGDRGAVLLEWGGEEARALDVRHGAGQLKDEQVVELLIDTDAAAVGVDVPFGWPVDFHAFLRAHEIGPARHLPSPGRSTSWRTRRAAWRETDRRVADEAGLGVEPLRVSFALLGATAASWAVVEAELDRRGLRVDRAGVDGPLHEAYPAAVRRILDLPDQSVPTAPPGFDLGRFADVHASNVHVRDALVAAVGARVRALGWSTRPSDTVWHLARTEGWIHLPPPGMQLHEVIEGARSGHRR